MGLDEEARGVGDGAGSSVLRMVTERGGEFADALGQAQPFARGAEALLVLVTAVAVAPVAVVDALDMLVLNTFTCAAEFTQVAAIEALRDSTSAVDAMVAEYRKRRDLFVAGLNRIPGFRCLAPEGAFYAWVHVADTGLAAEQVAALLLELPQRDLGGQQPDWDDLAAQCEWARKAGAARVVALTVARTVPGGFPRRGRSRG